MKEAAARIKINHLLEEAGWRFFSNKDGPANIQLEQGVNFTSQTFADLGEDFEKQEKGYIDFLLLDDHNFPLVVVEAKSEKNHPNSSSS